MHRFGELTVYQKICIFATPYDKIPIFLFQQKNYLNNSYSDELNYLVEYNKCFTYLY